MSYGALYVLVQFIRITMFSRVVRERSVVVGAAMCSRTENLICIIVRVDIFTSILITGVHCLYL